MENSSPSPLVLFLCLSLAVTMCSSAGVAFLLIDDVPPVLRASWRLWCHFFAQLPLLAWEVMRQKRTFSEGVESQTGVELASRFQKDVPSFTTSCKGTNELLHPYVTVCHIILAGIFLALHFSAWVWSLQETSLTHSLMWVTSYPVVLNWGQWVAVGMQCLWSWVCCSEGGDRGLQFSLREPFTKGVESDKAFRRPSSLETLGAMVAVIGGCVMTLDAGESNSTSQDGAISPSVHGDIAAFLGAVFFCGYLLIGKKLRPFVPVFLYMTSVVLCAAVACTALSLFVEAGTKVFFQTEDDAHLSVFGFFANSRYLAVAAYLGAASGVLGHTLVNGVLKYVSPLLISSALLLEPLVGSLLGAAFGMQGPPGKWTLVGGPLLMVGLVLILKGEAEDGKGEAEDGALKKSKNERCRKTPDYTV